LGTDRQTMMNIARWIEKWAVATPEKIALRFEGQEIGYPEFDDQIKTSARMLKEGLGVRPGDRIAYLGQNHPQILVLLFACARLGAIFVPLNWRLAPKEHLYMLKDSGAATLFVDEPYLEQCEDLKTELPDCKFVSVQGCKSPGWLKLADLLMATQGDDHYPDIGLDYPLLVIYTSGTTGFPKGAVLSQEAIEYNAFNSTIMLDMTSDDLILTVLPLFHVGGLNNQTTAGFYNGATVILHRIFDPEQVLDSMVHEKVTLTIMLPAHMPLLHALPRFEASDLSSLRSVLTGSTTIPDNMIRYWHDKGIPLIQMYGASETCPIAIHQKIANAFATEGSIGFPAMHCEVRIVDARGNDCAVDEPGEILIRGKNVMSHYWNDENTTKNNLVDGWFYSGDIGCVDISGCFHFIDRKKDVIISGSENIYPAEIENVLSGHPDILEVAVVGREDSRWGEIPVAVITNKEKRDLNKEQVLNWLSGKLGKYKHPRDVVFVDALPRNEMRKVLKDELREMVNG
jgi:fatty-acyl-CoA synthase